jgi:multidrug efflux system outer membrane protein
MIVICLGSLLAGCRVGPQYHRPSPLANQSVPDSFSVNPASTNNTPWKIANPGALPNDDWWSIFQETELDRLEWMAATNNQDFAASIARLDEAQATVRVARSAFFPSVDLKPSYTRQRTSFGQVQNGRPAGQSYNYANYSLPLEAGWEVDFWGRVRNRVSAARSRLAATGDDSSALKLSIQGEVAADYFTLRALAAETELLTRAIEAYKRSLELVLNRRKGGVGTDLDVAQAETQLRTAEAALPAVRLQQTKLSHALAVLCGASPMNFRVSDNALPFRQTPAFPITVPSELLERRPDIAAAERRMAAANADVGVATAAFYPKLTFSGLAGLQSVDAGAVFDWPSRFWAIGPSLEVPLFTGGRNRAELAFAKASYRENVASYRQVVLRSFQEVEDRLAEQKFLNEQNESEKAALVAAQKSLEIANNRYKAGLVTYLEVVTAQTSELNVERTVVQLRGQQMAAAVGLIKSLGGSWSNNSEIRNRETLSNSH